MLLDCSNIRPLPRGRIRPVKATIRTSIGKDWKWRLVAVECRSHVYWASTQRCACHAGLIDDETRTAALWQGLEHAQMRLNRVDFRNLYAHGKGLKLATQDVRYWMQSVRSPALCTNVGSVAQKKKLWIAQALVASPAATRSLSLTSSTTTARSTSSRLRNLPTWRPTVCHIRPWYLPLIVRRISVCQTRVIGLSPTGKCTTVFLKNSFAPNLSRNRQAP
jgi:hypothetical protein